MTTRTDDQTPQTADAQMPINPAETYERYMVPALFAPAAEHSPSPVSVPASGCWTSEQDGDRRPAGGAERGTHREGGGT